MTQRDQQRRKSLPSLLPVNFNFFPKIIQQVSVLLVKIQPLYELPCTG